MPKRAMKSTLCGLLMSVVMTSVPLAQQGIARVTSIAGTVRDSGGLPVALAQVSVRDVRGVSDSAGRFALAELPLGAGTLHVRRLGFAPLEVAVDLVDGRTDTLQLVLAAVARALPALNTESDATRLRLTDFHRHRKNGMGQYFNRKEIEERHARRLSDLLRGVPGVRIIPDRQGRLQLRMVRTSGTRDCPPDFWIDGIRAPYLNIDDVPLTDIEALEVYRGPAAMPPEFANRMGNPGCGVVVIWTRLAG